MLRRCVLRCLQVLNEALEKAKGTNSTVSGADAFKLYDTFGFPLELTQEYAESQHLTVRGCHVPVSIDAHSSDYSMCQLTQDYAESQHLMELAQKSTSGCMPEVTGVRPNVPLRAWL